MERSKLFIIFFLIISLVGHAQNNNFNYSDKIELLENEIKKTQKVIATLGHKIVNINAKNNALIKENKLMKYAIDSIKSDVKINNQAIQNTTTELGDQINANQNSLNEKTSLVEKNLETKTLWGAIALLTALCISLFFFLFFRKKMIIRDNAIDKINDAQKTLQEESIKLDHKLVEILDTQIKLQKSTVTTTTSPDVDHSLALKVADEIIRIETNLLRMDQSIKGYKQLSASVRRIKDNFLANGYELVDMVGKPYNEGMKVVANFVPDDNLKAGEQIITGIIKPQINYKRIMIQAAQITVSQNT